MSGRSGERDGGYVPDAEAFLRGGYEAMLCGWNRLAGSGGKLSGLGRRSNTDPVACQTEAMISSRYLAIGCCSKMLAAVL